MVFLTHFLSKGNVEISIPIKMAAVQEVQSLLSHHGLVITEQQLSAQNLELSLPTHTPPGRHQVTVPDQMEAAGQSEMIK